MVLGILAALVFVAAVSAGIKPAKASFPGKNGKIAFVAGGYDSQVYKMAPDGSGQTKLTDIAGYKGQQQWSADGKKVVFENAVPVYKGARPQIYAMNADSSDVVHLAGDDKPLSGVEPSWFPSGNKIALAGSRQTDGGTHDSGLYTMTFDALGETTSFTRLTSSLSDKCPMVSSDGKKIAFLSYRHDDHSGPGFYVMKAAPIGAKNPPVRIARNLPLSCPVFDWAPNGKKMVYATSLSNPDGTSRPDDLWVMNSDGTAKKHLTRTPDVDESVPSFSPSGTKIVFASDRDDPGGYYDNIWQMGADGSQKTRLTYETHQTWGNVAPDWGPRP